MAIFTAEVILKVIGLGCRAFVKDRFNLFDTVVVVFSIIEVLLADGSGATSSLRAFRLFRIFKIFRVGNLRIMLDSLAKTISSIGNYVILLILFMYVFALMGMQFFAGKLRFNSENQPDLSGEDRRYNFNNIWNSFILIFQLLIGDNWNDVMYDCMRSTSNIAFIYFVLVIIIGTIIMINLLIAIIISNFDNSRFFLNKSKLISALKTQLEEGKTHYHAVLNVLGDEVAEYAFKNDQDPEIMKYKSEYNVISPNNRIKKIKTLVNKGKAISDVHMFMKRMKSQKVLIPSSHKSAKQFAISKSDSEKR